MGNNPFLYSPVQKKEPLSKILIDFIQFFVIILAFLVISYLFLFIPNQVDGNSMYPNFIDKELIFTNRIGHILSDSDIGKGLDLEYKRGDVVVFQKPPYDPYIKRIIALPGDEIKIENGNIYVNNRQIEEKYIAEDYLTQAYDLGEGITHFIEDDKYFLIGDNRDYSQDSRFTIINQIEREYIKGKVFLRYTKCDAEENKCKLTFELIKQGEIKFQ